MSSDKPEQTHGNKPPDPPSQVGTLRFAPIKTKRKRFCERAILNHRARYPDFVRCGKPATWQVFDQTGQYGCPLCEACKLDVVREQQAAEGLPRGNPG